MRRYFICLFIFATISIVPFVLTGCRSNYYEDVNNNPPELEPAYSFEIEVRNNQWTIVGFDGEIDYQLTIPRYVDKALIQDICPYAFKDITSITHLHIYANILVIRAGVFSHFTNLTNINFGQNVIVQDILEGAFGQETIETIINFPASVGYVGWGNFLKSKWLANEITNLAPGTFFSPASNNLILGYRNTLKDEIISFDDVIVLSDFTILSEDSANIYKIVIKQTTWMHENAFRNLQFPRLEINYHDSYTFSPFRMISAYAFYGNTLLADIYFGAGIVSIGDSAFEGATNLQTFTMSESLTFIEKRAFYGASNLSIIFAHEFLPPIIHYCTFKNTHPGLMVFVRPHLVNAWQTMEDRNWAHVGTIVPWI